MIAICPSQEQLKSFSLGQLSDEQSDELALHLHQCDLCQKQMTGLETVEDTFVTRMKLASGDEPDSEAYESESECQLASARAMAALASASETPNGETQNHIPKRIGEYEVVRPLGHGGMGQVFLGRHTKLGRPVAIKFIAHHRRWDPKMVSRFESEMRTIGGLTHPNIVAAYDARDFDNAAVLVTEYIDGLDVGEMIKRGGRLEVADACAIVLEVAKALEYIDQQGLVHRDIKPSNIMVDREGHVKLLDLGLARLQADQQTGEFTATGQAIGTADYVAPEQINDGRNVDIRTDIYGLGCTLYKLLCGQAPFGSSHYATAFAKMNAHVDEIPESIGHLRGDIPEDISRLVDSMLAKSPDQRPQRLSQIMDCLRSNTQGSNLESLVHDRLQLSSIRNIGHPPVKQPETKNEQDSGGRRTWSVWAAIAAGLIGIAFGVWLGITITVKKADGTTASVVIPDGATAIVDSQGNIEVRFGDSEPSVIPKDRVNIQSGFDPRVGQTLPNEVNLDPAESEPVTFIYNLVKDSRMFDRVEPSDRIDVFVELPPNPSSQQSAFFESEDFRRKRIAAQKLVDGVQVGAGGKQIKFELTAEEKRRYDAAVRLGLKTSIEFHDSERDLIEDRMRMTGVWRTVLQRIDGKVIEHNEDEMMVVVRDQIAIYQAGGWKKYSVRLRKKGSQKAMELQDVDTETGQDDQFAIYRFLPNGRLEIGFSIEGNPFPATFEQAGFFVRLEKISQPETDMQQTAFAIKRTGDSAKVKIEFYLAEEFVDAAGERVYVGGKKPMEQIFAVEGSKQMVILGDSPILTNRDILAAQFNGAARDGLMINVNLTDQAADRVYRATRQGIGRLVAVVVEGKVICAPRIQSPIGKNLAISGDFTPERARKITEGIIPNIEIPVDAEQLRRRQRTQSMNNVRQIMLGLHNYHDAYGSFPSANWRPSTESESFSWRVALLPYMGFEELFSEFRFDEPWDSKHNRKLIDKMPPIYRHPTMPADSSDTNYVVFLGESTMMGKDKGIRFSDITDGTSNTVAVIEHDSEIPWTKPQDLDFVRDQPLTVRLIEKDGAVVGIGDGSVRFIPKDFVEKDQMYSLIQRNDGDPVRIPEPIWSSGGNNGNKRQ